MAVLSSLLGIGQQQPVAGPAIATTAFPAELAPYYKDILSKAQALYEDRTAEGYQPYQGPTIAEFTPEQQQEITDLSEDIVEKEKTGLMSRPKEQTEGGV